MWNPSMRTAAATIVWLVAAIARGAGEPGRVQRRCDVELIVLGVAQDAGAPQIGNPRDPAWADSKLARLATSLGLLDYRQGTRYLFEATPDLRVQLQRLDEHAPHAGPGLGLDGIFLTHAHIGHYAGLMFLGHESAGAAGIPIYAMPRMRGFLQSNGPWDQLVRYNNIVLRSIEAQKEVVIGEKLTVTPYLVPHRDEYSETVGFVISGPTGSVLFLPDIDSWDRWRDEHGISIEDMIRRVDVAFVDATFHDDHELPGRDMSRVPHPRIVESMRRFAEMDAADRSKVRFIHLNHTNAARFENSPAHREIEQRGYRVAREGEIVCLACRDPE